MPLARFTRKTEITGKVSEKVYIINYDKIIVVETRKGVI
ncbi:MAG: hypothetical protein QT03_C0001G1354 [archaeon GW2011_AR10]|nr:MAG: hypothetical protein QT03_C0001G1354 [archaeon GW2011_AR10]